MRAESDHRASTPPSWSRTVAPVVGLLVRWLFAALRATAFWALFWLISDAAGWGAAPVNEPAARLQWVLFLGALTGTGELLADWELRRRRRETDPPAS